MGSILKEFSRSAILKAIEDNLFQYLLNWAYSPHVEVLDTTEMIRVTTRVPSIFFNQVLRAKLTLDSVNSKIQETLEHFRSRRLPWAWRTGPATEPASLEKSLEDHGFFRLDEPGMAVRVEELPEAAEKPSGLKVLRVNNAEKLSGFVDAALKGFDQPSSFKEELMRIDTSIGIGRFHQHYLGLLGDTPVASSTLYLGAGVAGIYNLSAVPEARRRGIGTVMALVPLLDARKRGYRIGILHSSPMGFDVYRSIGFEEYCRLARYTYGKADSTQAGY